MLYVLLSAGAHRRGADLIRRGHSRRGHCQYCDGSVLLSAGAHRVGAHLTHGRLVPSKKGRSSSPHVPPPPPYSACVHTRSSELPRCRCAITAVCTLLMSGRSSRGRKSSATPPPGMPSDSGGDPHPGTPLLSSVFVVGDRKLSRF